MYRFAELSPDLQANAIEYQRQHIVKLLILGVQFFSSNSDVQKDINYILRKHRGKPVYKILDILKDGYTVWKYIEDAAKCEAESSYYEYQTKKVVNLKDIGYSGDIEI